MTVTAGRRQVCSYVLRPSSVANFAVGTTPSSARNFASSHGNLRTAARSFSVSGRTLS
jgi:hypothetical protein